MYSDKLLPTVLLRTCLVAVVFVLVGSGLLSDAQAQTTEAPAPQVQELADLLRDETTREALIRAIEAAAPEAEAAAADQPAAPPSSDAAATTADGPALKGVGAVVTVSIGQQIAKFTQAIAEDLAGNAMLFWDRLRNADRTFSGLSGAELSVLGQSLIEIGLVLCTSVGVLLVLRWGGRALYRRMGRAAAAAGLLGKGALIFGSILVDALIVVTAWASGYLLALTLVGDMGSIGIKQALFLNAFLVVEMVKIGFRAVISPTSGQLRLIAVSDQAAAMLSWAVNVVASIIGYGQLLVVPIINQNVSIFAGRGVSALIVLVALLVIAALAIRHRRPVAAWLLGGRGEVERGGLLGTLARYWHVPVLIYLATLLALVITRPGNVLLPLLWASAKIVGAIVLGVTAAAVLKRQTSRGVRMPAQMRTRLPLLERRLNSFVPKVLFALRYAILAAVAGFIAHTIDLVDVRAWLESRVGLSITTAIVSVTMILCTSFLFWLAMTSWIDYRLDPNIGGVPTARERTLLSLLRNAATIFLVIISGMFVLSDLGIDIAPLLASAGVLGLAIGFGAQKLVQDIITGIFIQFENAMNVGDVVTVGGTTGTVEKLTIRSVSLRDLEGVFHIIPFSSVDMVSNYMRGYGNFVCDMGVAYRESVDEARKAMHDAYDELVRDDRFRRAVLGGLEWFGLQAFGDNAVVLRARIKCRPGEQWGVGRAYNEIVKRVFDERGIEIPFPHQTLYFGEDKDGRAPPLRIADESRREHKLRSA